MGVIFSLSATHFFRLMRDSREALKAKLGRKRRRVKEPSFFCSRAILHIKAKVIHFILELYNETVDNSGHVIYWNVEDEKAFEFMRGSMAPSIMIIA